MQDVIESFGCDKQNKEKMSEETTAQTTSCKCDQPSEKVPPKAKIAMPCFKRIVLEVGKTYLYCTCGFAKDGGALCDGTCKTSDEIKGWEPKEFSVQHFNSGGYAICCCKR